MLSNPAEVVFLCTPTDTAFAEKAHCYFSKARCRRVTRLVPVYDHAVYVAHSTETLQAWDAHFPGLCIRVCARLRESPLGEGHAMYLPVAYDKWVVVINSPTHLCAAIEAAACLKGITTVACPAFDPDVLPTTVKCLDGEYTRYADRIFPA
jgi:hypothetical protein